MLIGHTYAGLFGIISYDNTYQDFIINRIGSSDAYQKISNIAYNTNTKELSFDITSGYTVKAFY